MSGATQKTDDKGSATDAIEKEMDNILLWERLYTDIATTSKLAPKDELFNSVDIIRQAMLKVKVDHDKHLWVSIIEFFRANCTTLKQFLQMVGARVTEIDNLDTDDELMENVPRQLKSD